MSSVNNLLKSLDSGDQTRLIFDRYFTKQISYTSNEVDSVVGFFKSRGFDNLASVSIATVLLQQSKIDNINVFNLLDTLKGVDKISLSNLVTAVLNANRSKISKLGYKTNKPETNIESRNIVY